LYLSPLLPFFLATVASPTADGGMGVVVAEDSCQGGCGRDK
jgi:hypothetical protein